jgi:4-alpha-glucanotransferase
MLNKQADLRNKAQEHGIQLEYLSAFGTAVKADAEALAAALAALGEETQMEKRATTESLLSLEPVAVSWGGRGFDLKFCLAPGAHERSDRGGAGANLKDMKAVLEIEIEGETPKERTRKVSLDLTNARAERKSARDPKSVERMAEGAREVRGTVYTLSVRTKIPLGYHKGAVTVRASAGGAKAKKAANAETETHSFLIIAAPERSFVRKKKKKPLGVFAPLYALRSKASWGIGDYADLEKLSRGLAREGVDFIGTLPLLSIFTGKPLLEPSPYSPMSRLFWSEVYVDPRLTDEWKKSRRAQTRVASKAFQARLSELNAAPHVDYARVAELKREVLEILAGEFAKSASPRRKQAFANFLKENPLAERFAEFRAAGEKFKKPWTEWPEKARAGALKRSDYRAKDKHTHLYAQWIAQTQLGGINDRAEAAGRAGLYLDFPLSVHAAGFDVWWFRNEFARGATAGAPPDPTFMHGQDWGILPLHPVRMRRSGYEYVRAALANHMRYAGYLRLDHVMGFYRLFWVLPKLGAKRGVYVRYPWQELFAILCLESHRNRCELIGEDLGTVPPEIRHAMTRHGILRMGIQQFAINPEGAKPFTGVPKDAIVSLNTHDLALFAAFWQGLDLVDQKALGYYGEGELGKRLAQRERAKAALVRLLKREKLLGAQGALGAKGGRESATEVTAKSVLEALLLGTARSQVAVMQLTLEDLWLETAPQNTPGTSTERANWVRKCRLTIEEILADKEFARVIRTCAKLRPRE